MHQPIDDKQQLANVKNVLRRLQNYTIGPEPGKPSATLGPLDGATAIEPAAAIDAPAPRTQIYFDRNASAAAAAPVAPAQAIGHRASGDRPSKRSWAIVAICLTLLAGGAWLGTKPPARTVQSGSMPGPAEVPRAIGEANLAAFKGSSTGVGSVVPATAPASVPASGPTPPPITLNPAPIAPASGNPRAAASPRQTRQTPPAPPKPRTKITVAAGRDEPAAPTRKVITRVKKGPAQAVASVASKTLLGAAIAPPPAIAPLPAIAPPPLRR